MTPRLWLLADALCLTLWLLACSSSPAIADAPDACPVAVVVDASAVDAYMAPEQDAGPEPELDAAAPAMRAAEESHRRQQLEYARLATESKLRREAREKQAQLAAHRARPATVGSRADKALETARARDALPVAARGRSKAAPASSRPASLDDPWEAFSDAGMADPFCHTEEQREALQAWEEAEFERREAEVAAHRARQAAGGSS